MNVKWRIWLEKDGRHVLGKGGAKILRAIEKHGSISKACKELGMSYRFVWNYLKRMEEVLGDAVVEKERGGVERGGTKLTPLGRSLLETYERIEKIFESALKGVEGRVLSVEGNTAVLEVKGELEEGEKVIVLREDP